ncbi:hypothetical protein NDI45_20445 [Leptolyngbya sp. GB1-A1]|uniref:hypothetical protein n=1 Tax=Leptolyngbya sp. GB1-A1 TaxID=2933908 RepID=UPI0032972284
MSEQSPSSTSLHGFCKTYNLSKTTVHRYCRDNGIPTSSGLSVEAVERLKVAFNIMEPLQNKAPSSSTNSKIVYVPSSHIEVLPQETASALGLLHSQVVKPKTFRSIEMNGTAQTLVGQVIQLHGQVQTMKATNDQTEASLDEREQTIEQAYEVALQLGKDAKAEVERNQQLGERSEEVGAKEEDLKKLLQKLFL